MHFLRFSLVCALIAGSSHVAAVDSGSDMLAKLRQSGEVTCRPTEPVFCANVHVACAGRSATPTFLFHLRIGPSKSSIVATPEMEHITEHYADAHAEWDAEGAYVILRPQRVNGYVKLLAEGKYIFRYYSPQGPLMSLGRCDLP